ncbi:MAG: UvrD-helicase domain-containing protein [Clostridiales bacterium]|nr:UvrD-helicase domain-containing protein [Clostridiales bacterium]
MAANERKKKEFSPEQKAAIETPGNVIVSAGAGSGKTTVMVERIVRKLLTVDESGKRPELDSMLIVTFTRASAADIRRKLAKRLRKLRRGAEQDSTNGALGKKERDDANAAVEIAKSAIEALPVCNIGTLHSFCQRLIRNYYYAAEVDPAAMIADDGDAKAMRDECIRRAVKAARDRGDSVTIDILDELSGRRDDDGTEKAVRSVLEFALSLSDTRGYLSKVEDDGAALAELVEKMSKRHDDLIEQAKRLSEAVAAAKFDNIAGGVSDLFGCIDFGFAIRKTQYRGKDAYLAELNDMYKTLKAACQKYREDLAEVEKAKSVGCRSLPYARTVSAIALDALDRYEARKAALGLIDYADLEHGALKVLSNVDCMKEIAKTVDYVFIDEFQDVNPLQAEIAQRLKDGARAEMFLVGDVKQSIYAFRRCNPKFFRAALNDSDYKRIDLNKNYRSAKQVIEFVNAVFKNVMKSDFGGADYSVDKLIFGRSDDENVGSADFYVIDKDSKRYGGFSAAAFEPYSVKDAKKGAEREDDEALLIADLILDYVDSLKEKEKKEKEKEQEQAEKKDCGKKDGDDDDDDDDDEKEGFGSIAVLVRAAQTPFCDRLVRLLRSKGIPCNFGGKTNALDYPEAEALIYIAKCIDNRFDDVALYTALRSPMGGFDDDELFEIAKAGEELAAKAGFAKEYGFGTGRKSYYFWQKVQAYVKSNKGEYGKRLKVFFERRDRLSAYAKTHDAADTLGKITSEIDFFQYVMENKGNPAAVDALISAAAGKKCSLSAFLESAADAELSVSDGGDAVTISTIHASKGLEYDFVIVANADKSFNTRDASAKCMAVGTDDAVGGVGGVAVKYPSLSTRESLPSGRWLLEKFAVPDRNRAEELRLFYVALTRAKKKLVVCGKGKKEYNDPREASSEIDFMRNIPPKVPPTWSRNPDDVKGSTGKSADGDAVDADMQKKIEESIRKEIEARIKADSEYVFDDGHIKMSVTAIAEGDGDELSDELPNITYDDCDVGESMFDMGGEEAARRGTAYHKAMELIDFDRPDAEKVKSVMTDGELVDFSIILTACEEMKKLTVGAKAYKKERGFIANLPVDGKNILVQGVIDLLIINADGTATIVDYKTTAAEFLMNENYLKQLALYAAAVERTTGLTVSSAYLYSFALGRTVKCSISHR